MGKRKKDNTYYHGKGIPKTKGGRWPFKGAPGTNIDKRNSLDGLLITRRKIDLNGHAYKDLDAAYKKHKPYDHVHDIVDTIRCEERPPNEKEKREFKKAKRKRKIW